MPSRYNTYNPDRKITQGSASKPSGPGSPGKVTERTASWPGLPGKASNWYKTSGKKVKTHPKSEGLC